MINTHVSIKPDPARTKYPTPALFPEEQDKNMFRINDTLVAVLRWKHPPDPLTLVLLTFAKEESFSNSVFKELE